MTDPNEPPYQVTFVITTEDLVDYLRVVQRTLNMFAAAAGAVGIIGSLIVAVLVDPVSAVVLLLVGGFLLLSASTRYFDRWRARRQGRSVIGTNATFTISKAGIEARTGTGTGHISWPDVTRVSESSAMLVLMRDRLTLGWLPKRALGPDPRREQVLAFIRRMAGSAGARTG